MSPLFAVNTGIETIALIYSNHLAKLSVSFTTSVKLLPMFYFQHHDTIVGKKRK